MQKRAFLCYILRAIRAGRCRERRYADQIYSDRLQNAPFRSHIFENFLRLRRQGGIDPLTKILYLWTDVPWSACACVSDTLVSPAETALPVEMSFGYGLKRPSHPCIRWGPESPTGMGTLGGHTWARRGVASRHTERCWHGGSKCSPAVDKLSVIRKGQHVAMRLWLPVLQQLLQCYSAAGRRVKCCDVCLFVCLPAYARNYTSDLHRSFRACCPWQWLGLPLAACTSSFMDDVIFAQSGPLHGAMLIPLQRGTSLRRRAQADTRAACACWRVHHARGAGRPGAETAVHHCRDGHGLGPSMDWVGLGRIFQHMWWVGLGWFELNEKYVAL